MRVIIKGGVWKNTEDEILKVAISKYGLNQWARISSLLVRKTPKQCKARWYEWLDPSIKKTEWSREEDEKLLHLAKLMPTQWRTIAPIVGRTANQCLERYQRLLDEAEAQEDQASGSSLALTGTGETAPSAEDVRKLRPGEIDPNPETKPARPDPIDMDEDEKEMLSEARARLANTQGKKAKRKARERALEESRRLSMLQKRRELKAAGIMTKPKPKKGEMDFNADIPLEKKPALGFYDTSQEANKEYKAPIGKTLAALNSRDESQDAQKGKRQHEAEEKSKQAKQAMTGRNEEQIRKLKEAEQISKRRKLNLPAAQVGEDELEQIVKLGQAGERTRSLVADGSNEATGSLLGEYSSLDPAKTARTPQRAPEDDTVMREARNLRLMSSAQTPLLGDANVEVRSADRADSAQTPNPLLTPRTTDGSRAEATPMRTPLRDHLGVLDGQLHPSSTPKQLKQARAQAQHQLRLGLSSLPAPQNNFELVDGEEDQDVDEPDVDTAPLSEEDAALRDAKLAQKQQQELEKALARRSQVVQRNLPRPAVVDLDQLLSRLEGQRNKTLEQRVQVLVRREMALLLHHDANMHPLPGSKHPDLDSIRLEPLSDESISAARRLVHMELAEQVGFPGASPDSLQKLIIAAFNDDEAALEQFENSLCAQWRASRTDITALSAALEDTRAKLAERASLATKGEKTLGKLLGGYQARSGALATSLKEQFAALSETHISLNVFQRLYQEEQGGKAERLDSLTREVNRLESRERTSQHHFRDLDTQRTQLQEECELLQAQIDMRHAEAFNIVAQ